MVPKKDLQANGTTSTTSMPASLGFFCLRVLRLNPLLADPPLARKGRQDKGVSSVAAHKPPQLEDLSETFRSLGTGQFW